MAVSSSANFCFISLITFQLLSLLKSFTKIISNEASILWKVVSIRVHNSHNVFSLLKTGTTTEYSGSKVFITQSARDKLFFLFQDTHFPTISQPRIRKASNLFFSKQVVL